MPDVQVQACSSLSHSFLSIINDETVYSWCSANHLMSCSRSAATTGVAMLSASHAVRQHELPQAIAKLPLLASSTPSAVMDVLRQHTIAGFYLPFLTIEDQLDLATEALQPRTIHWARKVMGTSRTLPVKHPLKWCRQCVQADMHAHGRSYWHIVHQFPTATVCDVHGEPLSWHDGRSKQWRLPHKERSNPIRLPANIMAAADHLAALSASLPYIEVLDLSSLRTSALHRLQEIGVIHSSKGARHERVSHWFSSTATASVGRLISDELGELCDGTQMPGLLWRQKRNNAIPWIMLWAALEWYSPKEAAQTFIAAVAGAPPANERQLQLFDGMSAGPGRAPKHVHIAFECCDSYAEVMTQLRASRADVVRWLEHDPALRTSWRSRLREGKQRKCVDQIKFMANSDPIKNRTELESKCNPEFRWMREHAPHQLAALIRSIPDAISPQSSVFD